jgi:tight adherence protein B
VTLAVLIGFLVAAVVLWPAADGRLPTRIGTPARDRTGNRNHAAARDVHQATGGLRRGGRGWRGRRGRGRTVALEAALAELVAAIAAPLRAGVAPSVALAAAEPSCAHDSALGPLLRDLVEATAAGQSAAVVWLRHADSHGSSDLHFVGQAWALSERTGAPLADALASGEEVLRARARGRQRVASAAAGPRASMAVLCLLPASGPVVGAAMGVGPRSLYFSSPVATASLLLGLVLAGAAWWWSRRILWRAA